jgi:hypothetical protein
MLDSISIDFDESNNDIDTGNNGQISQFFILERNEGVTDTYKNVRLIANEKDKIETTLERDNDPNEVNNKKVVRLVWKMCFICRTRTLAISSAKDS